MDNLFEYVRKFLMLRELEDDVHTLELTLEFRTDI